MKIATLIVIASVFLSSCRTPPPPPPPPPTPATPPSPTPSEDLVRVDADLLPELVDDLPAETLAVAIERELEHFGRRPAEEGVRLGDASCTVAELSTSLAALRDAARDPSSGRSLGQHVRSHFRVYRSAGRAEGALFTAYYEPVLEGRRKREGAFVYPLYRRPHDLVEASPADFSQPWGATSIFGRVYEGRLQPYYSRAEIDGHGALAGRDLELAWLADPVARFFLHVQGSGILRFPDGSSTRVGFAGSNGRPYGSIGRVLVAEGALDEPASAPAIQRWLRADPERRESVLAENPRYVFFRETPDGPIGKLGVTLTAGRSIAVDAARYPLGVLAYVDTEAPVVDAAGRAGGTRPLRRFVLAQDGGAAITGPGRVDLFFGTGERAGLEAGHLSSRGELYFLIPNCG